MKKNAIFVLLLCIVFSGYRNCNAQGVFFREHWAQFDSEISNSSGRMLRVNDAELSLHEVYGKRPEALTNVFTLINVPEDLFGLQGAELYLEVWDGGEGTVTEHFRINGHPYSITSGKANHDLVFTNVEVDVKHLKAGANTLVLLSDTEHHGIEVLLPGPCLLLRYGKSVQLPFD